MRVHSLKARGSKPRREDDEDDEDWSDDERLPSDSDDEEPDVLQQLSRMIASLQTKADTVTNTPPKRDKPCSHCGSERHDDLGCWRRLTCNVCGNKGHPSDRCHRLCKGCGKQHERGQCELEDAVNALRKWYDPVRHAGMLPTEVEQMLN